MLAGVFPQLAVGWTVTGVLLSDGLSLELYQPVNDSSDANHPTTNETG
jgi:hypothetical protein